VRDDAQHRAEDFSHAAFIVSFTLARPTSEGRPNSWFREASRVEPRDYVDTAAALDRYTVEQIIGFAQRLDPGLTDRDFADAAERLDHWGDGVFASFGLGAEGIAELRARFAAWPRS
jgi:hypothetical protein